MTGHLPYKTPRKRTFPCLGAGEKDGSYDSLSSAGPVVALVPFEFLGLF